MRRLLAGTLTLALIASACGTSDRELTNLAEATCEQLDGSIV